MLQRSGWSAARRDARVRARAQGRGCGGARAVGRRGLVREGNGGREGVVRTRAVRPAREGLRCRASGVPFPPEVLSSPWGCSNEMARE